MKLPSPITILKEPILQGWCNALLRCVRASRPLQGTGYDLEQTPEGWRLRIGRNTTGTLVVAPPFSVIQTDSLSVKVKGGRVTLHGISITLADSDAIAVPAGSTAFKVWVSLANEFGTDSTAIAPSISSGASGWSGYPAQPVAGAQRHWLLAEIASSSTAITGITRAWNGGDLPWPPTLSFWA